MANSLAKPAYVLAFFFVVFLLAVEVPVTEAQRLCRFRSQTWSGFCGSTSNCNRQCRNSERAFRGSCHRDGIGRACFCYYRVPATGARARNGRVCRLRSQTWSGFCGSTNNCNRQCRNSERAFRGACHRQGVGRACFCYYRV